MQVRYFAGAAEAAGVSEESTTHTEPATVAALADDLGVGRERLQRVLAVSAFLVDGRIAGRDDMVAPGARVDVLPPFAGG